MLKTCSRNIRGGGEGSEAGEPPWLPKVFQFLDSAPPEACIPFVWLQMVELEVLFHFSPCGGPIISELTY